MPIIILVITAKQFLSSGYSIKSNELLQICVADQIFLFRLILLSSILNRKSYKNIKWAIILIKTRWNLASLAWFLCQEISFGHIDSHSFYAADISQKKWCVFAHSAMFYLVSPKDTGVNYRRSSCSEWSGAICVIFHWKEGDKSTPRGNKRWMQRQRAR